MSYQYDPDMESSSPTSPLVLPHNFDPNGWLLLHSPTVQPTPELSSDLPPIWSQLGPPLPPAPVATAPRNYARPQPTLTTSGSEIDTSSEYETPSPTVVEAPVIPRCPRRPVKIPPQKGPKHFPCPYGQCDMVLRKKSTFEVHLRSHTGEKPFNCPFCPRSFTINGNLNRHLKTCKGNPLRRLRRIPSSPNSSQ